MRIAISSGHGKYVAGAVGILREHEEAVLVVDRLALELKELGVGVETYEDTVSKSQNENLNRLTDWHNSQSRDLDVSIHFNAFDGTAHGTECLYVTQEDLAASVAYAIARAGEFTNRGAKLRTDLFWLSNTDAPSVLVEVCFVDNKGDAEKYQENFDFICQELAKALAGVDDEDEDEIELPEQPAPSKAYLFAAVGKCSHFGGPEDYGVTSSEGLAFHYKLTEENQHLFLPMQPKGTTGLARRLNAKAVHYVACRWDYAKTPKEMLAGDQMALVMSTETGKSTLAFPSDWGPHGDTKRVCDLSPAIMRDLALVTDDEVQVIYPYSPED